MPAWKSTEIAKGKIMIMQKKLLCADLDGTMFPLHGRMSNKHLKRLKKLLNKYKNVKLCYVTGRDLKLANKAIRKYSLPLPDYMITDVGTNIYLRQGSSLKLYPAWNSELGKIWPSGTATRIRKVCTQINGITQQPKSKQGKFKASFYIRPGFSKRVLENVRKKTKVLNIQITTILSKGSQKSMLLDILPPGISKSAAIKALAKKVEIGYSNVVFAGNSGNDYHVLLSNLKAILVNNAEDGLKKLVMRKVNSRGNAPLVYFANGRFDCANGNDICGVLEGALYYGVFSGKKGMRIQIHSIHGLINRRYTDLGRDDDTGGQVVYVVELAKSLGKLPEVEGVDLFTRRIIDKKYPNYAKRIEYLSQKVRIVRVDCGPKRYVKKTELWPHIDEYVKNTIKFNEEEGIVPDIMHANYADSGLACSKLSKLTGVPFIFTAHSLGKPKMEKLGINKKNYADFERKFHFSIRLKAEQEAMDKASAIIVSTRQELEEQYSKYQIDVRKVHVVPPGINKNDFHPFHREDPKYASLSNSIAKKFDSPRKPIILAMSRLDPRKNLPALANAFCRSKVLPRLANLIIVTGLKKKPDAIQKGIYLKLQKIIKATNNTGNVFLVNFVESGTGVGNLYRIAAKSHGVFVNPALIEPFGLTIIESSACGLPVIATKYGGPSEIIHDRTDGILVNPTREKDIASAITKLIKNRQFWLKISKNAIANAQRYSWDNAAKKETDIFLNILNYKNTKDVETALVGFFKHIRQHK